MNSKSGAPKVEAARLNCSHYVGEKGAVEDKDDNEEISLDWVVFAPPMYAGKNALYLII